MLANISSSDNNDFIASVNWISPVLSCSVTFKCSKIDPFKIYLPQTARSDGASFEDGFSTISSILIIPSTSSPFLITLKFEQLIVS